MLSARRTLWVSPDLQYAEIRIERVERKQAPDQRIALSEDQFDGLGRLENTDDSREHAQDTSGVSRRCQVSRWWLREEAPVARPFTWLVDRHLPFEAEDTPIDDRFPEDYAGVVE
jgi:hypothetical protein